MPEIRTVTTLKRKRAEIAASIKLYEKQLAQARSDLAHVEATMRIFAASGKCFAEENRVAPRDVGNLWSFFSASA
jgi:hypothetical protein